MHFFIRSAVIDHDPLFREGVRTTLTQTGKINIVAEGTNVGDALYIAEALSPDLIIMDINIPGNGIAATAAIAEAYPEIKIVILTESQNESDVTAAMSAGAQGYLLKTVDRGDFVAILRAVHGGQRYVEPAIAAAMLHKWKQAERIEYEITAGDHLTARENMILDKVSEGLTNKEIAWHLRISDKTVKRHMNMIMQKLHVRNRIEAVLIRQSGWRMEGRA